MTTLTNTASIITVHQAYEYPQPAVPLRVTYEPNRRQLSVYHPSLTELPDAYLAAVSQYNLPALLDKLLPPNTERCTLWLVGYPDPSRERLHHRVRCYYAARVSRFGTHEEPRLLEQLEHAGLPQLPKITFQPTSTVQELAQYGAQLHSRLYTDPRPVQAFLLMPEHLIWSVHGQV